MMKRWLASGGLVLSAFWTAAGTTGQPLAAQTLAAVSMGDAPTRTETSRAPSALEQVLATPVSVELSDVPVRVALEQLAERSGVRVTYSRSMLDVERHVTVRGTNLTLGDALRAVLVGTHVIPSLTLDRQVVLVRAMGAVQGQNGTITGKVLNATTKQPVTGVSILLDDATKGVVTADDGTFRITAPIGDRLVNVRGLGFVRYTKRVTVTENQSIVLEIMLEPSTNVLDEVVVAGTVVATERKQIATPITVITASDIEKRGITRIDQLLRGEVPGVYAMETGSSQYDVKLGGMATTNVYARGSSNLGTSAKQNPLKTYVDGVELLDPSYLGTIDPRTIERIEIITGPQAATIYGSGAMGGVMQIFTKNGAGRSAPDLTVSMKLGLLKSNFSSSITPAHNDAVSLAGGSGNDFTYSATLSHLYVGQWQPGLFSRTLGASVGATHRRGPVSVTGAVSLTGGRNGTSNSIVFSQLNESGVTLETGTFPTYTRTQRIASSESQNISLNVDYQTTSYLQQHVTVGRSATAFALDPVRPAYSRPADSLYRVGSSNGKRSTASYNSTIAPPLLGSISSTLTLGANGSWGDQETLDACLATNASTSYIGCFSGSIPSVSKSLNAESWGGFGQLRIGFFDRLYLTTGLRGERNPAYGREHKIDWTPTQGIAFTNEVGDWTIKLLGSYGRATRPPLPSMRLMFISQLDGYAPSSYVSQFASPAITPEYSRGPQGGIEAYYGNHGSITINRYRQTVVNLIESIPVDSLLVTYLAGGYSYYIQQYQYLNTGTVRTDGWESTASVNLAMFTVKGTYSWVDSRIVSSSQQTASFYIPGSVFQNFPSHIGNVTVGYAHGGTSVTLVTNYIGAKLRARSDLMGSRLANSGRLKTLQSRSGTFPGDYAVPGYTRTNLAISHRLNGWATSTLNVDNIGNKFNSDLNSVSPTLGRQTQFGLSLRYPTSR